MSNLLGEPGEKGESYSGSRTQIPPWSKCDILHPCGQWRSVNLDFDPLRAEDLVLPTRSDE